MKKLLIYFIVFSLCFSCKNNIESTTENSSEKSTSPQVETADFAIIIHGGAGTILKKNMTPEKEAAYKAVYPLAGPETLGDIIISGENYYYKGLTGTFEHKVFGEYIVTIATGGLYK